MIDVKKVMGDAFEKEKDSSMREVYLRMAEFIDAIVQTMPAEIAEGLSALPELEQFKQCLSAGAVVLAGTYCGAFGGVSELIDRIKDSIPKSEVVR